jgi:tetratricopeptide (TPR) repeat protein
MTAEEYLELGLAYIKEKNWEAALSSLRESHNKFPASEAIPPVLFSALGLAIAMEENKVQEGLNQCRRALEKAPRQAEIYYHFGMVYLKAGKKGKAYSAFRGGLKISPDHAEMLTLIRRMGVRKKPILSFLPREHFINRFLGTWFVENKKTGKR